MLFKQARMVMIKFYSNETVEGEWARGIFCDINVHLRDKFERNFGGILRKWKTLGKFLENGKQSTPSGMFETYIFCFHLDFDWCVGDCTSKLTMCKMSSFFYFGV